MNISARVIRPLKNLVFLDFFHNYGQKMRLKIKQIHNIKSFMKTGIVPLNPASIDRPKVVKDATCVNANISATIDPNTCCNYQINNSNDLSTFDVSVASNNNHTRVTDSSIDNVSNTTDTTISNFNSSVLATSVLDRILDETTLSSDAEDKGHLPNRSTSTLTKTTMLSNSRQSHLQENSTSQSQQLNTSRRNYRKRKTHIRRLLASNRQMKKVLLCFPCCCCRNSSLSSDDATINISPVESLKAMTETLQAIFVLTPDHLQNKSTKQTLICQSSGQVMTEQKVVEQLAKQNQKENSK